MGRNLRQRLLQVPGCRRFVSQPPFRECERVHRFEIGRSLPDQSLEVSLSRLDNLLVVAQRHQLGQLQPCGGMVGIELDGFAQLRDAHGRLSGLKRQQCQAVMRLRILRDRLDGVLQLEQGPVIILPRRQGFGLLQKCCFPSLRRAVAAGRHQETEKQSADEASPFVLAHFHSQNVQVPELVGEAF